MGEPTLAARRVSRWLRGASALLLVAGAPVLASPLPAQDAGPCDSTKARAFDFWLGDWTIEQRILTADGRWRAFPARTSVSRAAGGCALVERWEGTVQFFWEGMTRPEKLSALSVRAYDSAANEWRIHWMDSRSPRFGPPYVGGFTDGVGEFFSSRQTPDGPRRSRITFSEITADSVHWDLAVSSDDGRTWTRIWIMEMRRSRE